jgi:hypothetical protein
MAALSYRVGGVGGVESSAKIKAVDPLVLGRILGATRVASVPNHGREREKGSTRPKAVCPKGREWFANAAHEVRAAPDPAHPYADPVATAPVFGLWKRYKT